MNNLSPSTVTRELLSCCPTPILRQGALLIKNDGHSGITYGGNKVRKLAPVFERLRAAGYRRLLTVGAAGSHHVLASALFAPGAGLECAAILVRQPYTPHAERMLRSMSACPGLDLYPCFTLGDVLSVLRRERGRAVAWVGPGAIGPLAASGYDAAFDEWMVQRRELELGNRFEHHVVAAGSGGTAAGLLAGLVKHGVEGRVVAVAVNDNPALGAIIAAQARGVTRRRGDAFPRRTGQCLTIDRSAVGRGYGYPSRETESAILRAEEVGLHLEHTYTAKAYSVAVSLVDRHPQDVVVFWQTLSQRPLPSAEGAIATLAPALRRLLQPV